MRISYTWLKQYVDIKLPPEKLAEILTMAGLSVESVQAKGDDTVLEIEITSNRPDWLSVIGVAREIAALTGKKLRMPSFVVSRSSLVKDKKTKYERRNTPPQSAGQANDKRQMTIKIEAKDLCPRYTARVIRDVKIEPSPGWLAKTIDAIALRPVNNVVDITNYCLFETGEPMHAFDMDKIEGGVIVRRAKKGEKMVTIDGVERTLDESMLIIADEKRPIAIAGVMGGLGTEVTSSTKNILLEAAYFDPVSIRRTSRKLGLSTDSSYRFERRVDTDAIAYASDRASQLILELAGGVAGVFLDIGSKAAAQKMIPLRHDRIKKVLGIEVTPAETKKILAALGVVAKTSSKEKSVFIVPSFRNDLQDEVDLIEEVARIYGYEKIPLTVSSLIEQPMRKSADMIIEKKIRGALVSLGLNEIITYSLLSNKLLSMVCAPQDDIIKIANPLSSEQEMMRPSLIPGMLNAMSWNVNRKTADLRLFELGNIYFNSSNREFSEKKALSIGITGQEIAGWTEKPRSYRFCDLVGIFETLLSELGIEPSSYSLREKDDERFQPSFCAAIEINGVSIGIAGEIAAKTLHNFDMSEMTYVLEVEVEELLRHAVLEKRFKDLPKYPSVVRDISIVVAKGIAHEKILSTIRSSGTTLLKNVDLIDRYEGGQIPHGKTSLTYRLEYQDPSKTLTEKEVQDVHAKVIAELDAKFDAKLR